MVHYPLLLGHWIHLWHTAISFWPTGCLYGTLPSPTGPLDITLVYYYLLLTHWISLWYTTLSCWPTGYLYCTLLSSTGPLDISLVQYPLLLAIIMLHSYLLLAHWKSQWYIPLQSTHWLSLMYTLIFYWPTGYLSGTLPTPIDPMAISMVYYPPLLAHWLSL